MIKMSELKCPNCGYSVFFPLKEKCDYKCIKCNEEIQYTGDKHGFFAATDNEALKMITNLGYDIAEKALESGVVKTGIMIFVSTYLSPSMITVGAIGAILACTPGLLKAITEKKLFSEKTIQQEFEELFNKTLKKILKKGKKPDNEIKYYQFRIFFERCRSLSDIIFQKLQAEGKNENFFERDTIEYIYYSFYTENPQQEEFDNIIEVSEEIIKEYKKAILNDSKLKEEYLEIQRKKDVTEKLEYLKRKATWIECIVNENSSKLSDCINRIKALPIKCDNKEYLEAYSKKLFFEEKNSDLTLGKIYIDPSVKDSVKKASEVINEWFENDDEHTTLLILGSAGIGKSSLCSKIIADAMGEDIVEENNRLFRIPFERVYIRSLRKCVRQIKGFPYGTIDELIDMIFAPSGLEIDYDNKVFILDGLDELAVLYRDFSVESFIKKLNLLTCKNYKILITSRESEKYYFADESRIKIETLLWNENDMNKWCEKYSTLNRNLDAFFWCDQFHDFYSNLDPGDKRKEVFLVPVILYISAYSKIDFSSNSSVCQIYDKAFRCLLDRGHIINSASREAFVDNPDEENRKKVYWQYTKELAFQMAISGSLILSSEESEADNYIQKAQDRTRAIISKENTGYEGNFDFDIDNADYLSVFQFAKSDDNGQSIEFVHKTVYEYFAAVKLFEDYFKNLTYKSTAEDTWKIIIQAFRHSFFEFGILKYLADLMKGLDTIVITSFFDSFIYGMAYYEIFEQFKVDENIDEYKKKGIGLISIKQIFGNLITMLSLMGYKNIDYYKLHTNDLHSTNKKGFDFCFKSLLPIYEDSYYDFSGWCLDLIDMSGMNLSRISFTGANLSYAKMNAIFIENPVYQRKGLGFSDANMVKCELCGVECYCTDFIKSNCKGASIKGSVFSGVNFEKTNLCNADLSGSRFGTSSFKSADLRNADLRGVMLNTVTFENADLRGADMRGITIIGRKEDTKFSGAKYNNRNSSNGRRTIFPKGFQPEKYGMVLDNSPFENI